MEDRVSMLLGEQVLPEPGGLGSPPLKTGFPCFLGNRYGQNREVKALHYGGQGFHFSL
jgi:hypothetical protein